MSLRLGPVLWFPASRCSRLLSRALCPSRPFPKEPWVLSLGIFGARSRVLDVFLAAGVSVTRMQVVTPAVPEAVGSPAKLGTCAEAGPAPPGAVSRANHLRSVEGQVRSPRLPGIVGSAELLICCFSRSGVLGAAGRGPEAPSAPAVAGALAACAGTCEPMRPSHAWGSGCEDPACPALCRVLLGTGTCQALSPLRPASLSAPLFSLTAWCERMPRTGFRVSHEAGRDTVSSPPGTGPSAQ